MKKIHIDIETFSDEDLDDVGVYKYVESPLFSIDLCSYSIDDGPVQIVDLANGEKIPQEVLDAIQDTSVEKHIYNASFERICFSKFLGMPSGTYLSPENWHCSRVLAGAAGLPLSLAGAGAALDISKKKLNEGHELVLFFSKPCKPTKARPDEKRHLPKDYPEKWEQYKKYNIRDVEAEMEVEEKIGFQLSETEYRNYILSEEINDRGVLIDVDLCEAAVNADARYTADLVENLKAMTGLDNPRSVQQFKPWLDGMLAQYGLPPVPDVTKKTIDDLADKEDLPEEIKKIILMKKTLGKTSVKKFTRMINCRCEDGRARGLFQFNGAARTGRFAGRLIQLQNLTKNNEDTPNILEIREVLKKEGYDGLCRFGDVSDLLSQLVRTAIIPAPGKVFVDADFAAVEARVLAWLANEQWRLDAFARGEDIYCASASAMFGVPVVKNGENGHLRKKGKVAELACGYGGSEGALLAFGADKMGLNSEEMQKIVKDWRAASPNITKYWWDVDSAVKDRLFAVNFMKKHGITVTDLNDPKKIESIREKIISKTASEAERERPGNEKYRQEKILNAEVLFDDGLKRITEKNKITGITKLPGAGNCMTKIALLTDTTKINGYNKCDAVGNEILIKLPSGRNLLYPNSEGKEVDIKTKAGRTFKTEGATYYMVDSRNKWSETESYGPKFVENITQATARDLLCNSMMTLHEHGWEVCIHVHDEVLVEVPEEQAFAALEEISELMGRCPDWAQGLILRADGYLSPCFLKEGFDDKAFLKSLEPKQKGLPERTEDDRDDIL